MIKKLNSIMACGLLLMSIGLAYGQTTDERKLEFVVQTGHTESVQSVAFSPNGTILASGSEDKTIKIWDVKTNQLIKTLEGHDDAVNSVIFSSDGKTIASGSSDRTVKLWNSETGQIIKSLEVHTDAINSVTFSPDGKIIASGSSDKTIRLWNVETGQLIKSFDYTDSIETVAFSPDGKILAGGSYDSTINLWDVETGKLVKIFGVKSGKYLLGSSYAIETVAFSPDGKILASGGWSNPINLWDVETGLLIKSIEGNSTGSISFSPDGKNIITERWDKIELRNVNSNRLIKVFDGHTGKINSVMFSSDGKMFASASDDKTIKLWNVETGNQIKPSEVRRGLVRAVAFSPNGKTLAFGSEDSREIKLWSVESNQQITLLKGHASSAYSVAFSPNGKILASGSADDTIKLWNVEIGQQIKTLEGHTSSIFSVAFSSDGKTLASGSFDKTIKLWNIESGQLIKSLAGHTSVVSSVAFSPDGKTLVSGSNDNTIKLWDVEAGRLIKSLVSHTDGVYSVAFSPDGNTLASGSLDNTIKLWDVESGQLIKTLEGHTDKILSVVFSPDGKTLASTSWDRTIRLWNVENGFQVNSLEGHSSVVYSVAFSPDSRFIISCSGDLTINFWDRNKSNPLATLTFLKKDDWVIVTSDGRFDASEGALKLIHYTYGLEVINLDQLKEAYYEPGLLQKLLGYSKEPLRPIVPLKDVKLYPEVVEQTVAPDSTKLTIKLKNRGGGIGAVQVFVGNEFGSKLAVEDARDVRLKQNPNVPEATLYVDLQGTGYLKGKPNRVTVVTSNYLKEIGKGNIQSRGTEIVWLAGGKEEEYKLPTLYAIVGGVSDYAGDNLKLRFAAKDAEDFSNALSLGAKKLFCDKTKPNCIDKVNITTLSTSGNAGTILPTKENFVKAFREVAAKAKPEDIVVIYLAGHGVSFGVGTDSYFYLTQEARTTSREDLAKVLTTSAISSDELRDWLTPDTTNPNDIFVKAMKQVVILDTCASGNAAGQLALTAKRDLSGDQIRAVEFLKDKTSTFVLMASTADAPSYEASQFGQGLLTYSLLQAMKGAALDKGEYVDVQQLFSYAQKEVPQLASNIGGVQRPIVSAPLGKTFVIGQMTDAEKKNLNLPAPKPLLLRPLLTNPETGDDDLKLIPALRKMLDAESSYEVMRRSGKGDPTLIYIDDDTFPGAVRVTGTYTVEGETVRVKAFLRQDGKTIATLPEISAPKEIIMNRLFAFIQNELAKAIVK